MKTRAVRNPSLDTDPAKQHEPISQQNAFYSSYCFGETDPVIHKCPLSNTPKHDQSMGQQHMLFIWNVTLGIDKVRFINFSFL